MSQTQQLNQFGMAPIKGQASLITTPFTISVQILTTSVNTIIPGDYVKLVAATSNAIVVDKCEQGDTPIGVVLYSPKISSYTAGKMIEIGLPGTIVTMEAGAEIARGADLQFTPTGTLVITNAGTYPIVGTALDAASGSGSLVRVWVKSTFGIAAAITSGTINNCPIGGTTPAAGAFTSLEVGSLATPITLATNPGASVTGSVVNLLHSAGAGDCDDIVGAYSKVSVLGDGDSGLTAVAEAARVYIGDTGVNSVVQEAYGSQPWARHRGTGGMTAMSALSALVDVSTDAFTVVNTINAGHFHVKGAATVTGQFDGVMVECYPDVTSLDSLLALVVDSGAVVGAAIRIVGAPVADILLSGSVNVYSGVAVTRAAARAAAPADAPIGSLFVGQGAVATTKPNLYLKTANAGADTDWERVVTQASD
jgi:hypothetical protein